MLELREVIQTKVARLELTQESGKPYELSAIFEMRFAGRVHQEKEVILREGEDSQGKLWTPWELEKAKRDLEEHYGLTGKETP